MRRDISGFSLIEIAIVLIIIGLISGMSLPALRSMRDWQKAATTAQNQEKILYALASYAIQNRSLPYAANPTNFSGKQDIGARRRRGIVPYADLGLPESVAKDGYHHWITYVMDHDYATLPEKPYGKSTIYQLKNRLCEMPQYATYLHLNPLHIKNGQKNIALALISHGVEGKGAYPDPLGSGLMGSDEKQNATSDNEIIDRPLSQDPQDPFSHKVVWVTASNLLATYGRSPCPPLEEIPEPSKLRFNWGDGSSQKK